MMQGNVNPHSPEYLSADRWLEFFIPMTILFAVSCMVFALRFVAAFVARKNLWLDDYFAIFAAIIGLGMYITIIVVLKNIGYGRHVVVAVQEHPTSVTTLLKTIFALGELSAAFNAAAKCSIICFLWRIFSLTSMRWYLVSLLWIVAGWYIAVVFTNTFLCVPIRAAWDLTITEKKCLNMYNALTSISWPNMLIDFAITLLPIPYIWRLKIDYTDRILVSITLVSGGATSIISAVRLASITNNFSFEDPTWSTVTYMKWNAIEIYSAIIAICLPTLRPLVLLAMKETKSSSALPLQENPTIGSRRLRLNKNYCPVDEELDANSEWNLVHPGAESRPFPDSSRSSP